MEVVVMGKGKGEMRKGSSSGGGGGGGMVRDG